MKLDWTAIGTLCAVAALTGGAFAAYVRMALAEFQVSLFEKLDGRYANEKAVERRLTQLEEHTCLFEPIHCKSDGI